MKFSKHQVFLIIAESLDASSHLENKAIFSFYSAHLNFGDHGLELALLQTSKILGKSWGTSKAPNK